MGTNENAGDATVTFGLLFCTVLYTISFIFNVKNSYSSPKGEHMNKLQQLAEIINNGELKSTDGTTFKAVFPFYIYCLLKSFTILCETWTI